MAALPYLLREPVYMLLAIQCRDAYVLGRGRSLHLIVGRAASGLHPHRILDRTAAAASGDATQTWAPRKQQALFASFAGLMVRRGVVWVVDASLRD